MPKPSAHQAAYHLAKFEKNYEGAVKTLEESAMGARDLLMRPSIKQELFRLSRIDIPQPSRGLETYGLIPPWDRSKALILHGRSGLGKSSLARSLLPTALFVSRIDDLKQLGEAHFDGIIFDDMNFMGEPMTGKGKWAREWQVHLVDYDYRRTIHGRYYDAIVPAGTAKIFTTNLSPREMMMVSDEAIKRRTTAWFVDGEVGRLTFIVQW